jgi:hypothetical protein
MYGCAFKGTVRRVRLLASIGLLGGLGGCTESGVEVETAYSSALKSPETVLTAAPVQPVAGPPAGATSTIRFVEATAGSGIDFTAAGGMDERKMFPTSLGSGVALLDYDGDGLLDVYFCSTNPLPLPPGLRPGRNRLFRNQGSWRFEDVTEQAGLAFSGFSQGVTVGDIDNDGHDDLFVANYGTNLLYRNQGDGTFRDVTAGSGLEGPPWSCGATFLDYDEDGTLDLYVSCYGEWSAAAEGPKCFGRDGAQRIYCSPLTYTPARHYLYRGLGNGAFEDRTEAAGVLRRDGRGLGVVAADLNGDGHVDIYVANDMSPNFLFMNRGDGTFDDVTESSGTAGDDSGAAQGSMGVAVGDVEGDGRQDVVVTNYRGQHCALYHNHGEGQFTEISGRAGLIRDTRFRVGWGCGLEDFDNDGALDLMIFNGEVDLIHDRGRGVPADEQHALVYRNPGDGQFQRLSDAGPYFARPHLARGAAFGDLDNDGDVDVVVSRVDSPASLLRNETPPGRWARFRLIGGRSNRSAIGATVTASAGGRLYVKSVKAAESYLSVNDPRVLIGLGDAEQLDSVEVHWPSGLRTLIERPALGTTIDVTEPPVTNARREALRE